MYKTGSNKSSNRPFLSIKLHTSITKEKEIPAHIAQGHSDPQVQEKSDGNLYLQISLSKRKGKKLNLVKQLMFLIPNTYLEIM